MNHPTAFTWDAEARVMSPKWPRLAASRFEGGRDYLLADVEHRSDASHRHEFAWLREAWNSLPEHLADEFPTTEHLRKWALIQAGFFHETMIDAGSSAAALRVASYARSKDEFAHVVVRGHFVVERTAKSQSMRAMGKADFQASKTAIMEIVAGLIGVDPATLQRQQEAA